MGVRLAVSPRDRGGGAQEDALYEFEQDRILIGRGAGADVRLPHASVSTRHATIEQRGGRYVIVDHGSTNGTYVQSARLVPERAKPLRDGDVIGVGAFVIVWKEGVPITVSANAERTASLARRLLREVQGEAPSGARIVVLHGPQEGSALEIPAPPARLVIGRADSCDLPLHDADASREHVELIVDLDGVVARDRGSKNGLLVNDRPVHEKRLGDRDELLIGATMLVFEDPAESALRAAEQAPDEAIPEPAPPLPAPPAEAAAADDPEAPTGEPDAPPVSRPSMPAAPPPARRIAGLELFVYALAAGVLVLSIAGLVLLLRAS